MRIELEQKGPELSFRLELSEEDNREGDGQHGRIQLLENTFRFLLPFACEIHPDLLATALLSVVLPFAGRRIEVPRAVSITFAETVYHAFGKELNPVDSQLQARQPGSRPGLAFSGGVDSIASMLLMPEESALVFGERVEHPNVSVPKEFNTYNTARALNACAHLQNEGRPVYQVQTDHEYIIGPYPDWPIWTAAEGPLMLMADALDLDSVWVGSTLDNTYIPPWNGWRYFSWEYIDKDPWQQTMTTVGIPIVRAVGGISEIGTAAIVRASPYRNISTSCANGPAGQPCMTCAKCLRKTLTMEVLDGTVPGKAVLQRFADQAEIQDLSDEYMDLIFMYCFWKLPPLPNMYFRRVQKAVQAICPNMSFLERWYPKSLEHIPDQYRDFYVRQKDKYLQDYTEEDIRLVESWQPAPFVLPKPGIAEIAATQARRIALGAKRRAGNYVRRMCSRISGHK